MSATPLLAPIRLPPTSRCSARSGSRPSGRRLELLEEVGVHCPSETALAVYAEHGAVDRTTKVVRIPADVVVGAMSRARARVLGARSPAHDLVLDGSALYVATDGCGIETVDPAKRERRASVKEDVAAASRLDDALTAVWFYWPLVSAHDHPATAPLHEIDASVRNTVKHVQTETLMGASAARYAVEIARVLAAEDADLRARPPL
jgi:trimethylamine:corrinoid methyltransferase-like protein